MNQFAMSKGTQLQTLKLKSLFNKIDRNTGTRSSARQSLNNTELKWKKTKELIDLRQQMLKEDIKHVGQRSVDANLDLVGTSKKKDLLTAYCKEVEAEKQSAIDVSLIVKTRK